MANSVEVSVGQAIEAVVSFPWCGQIAEQIYVGKRPVSNDEDQIGLTAVWKGAERLADDPTVRCIVLEKNPYRVDLENAIRLTIDQVGGANEGDTTRSEIVFRAGKAPVIDGDRQHLVQTVLDNIAQLSVRP